MCNLNYDCRYYCVIIIAVLRLLFMFTCAPRVLNNMCIQLPLGTVLLRRSAKMDRSQARCGGADACGLGLACLDHTLFEVSLLKPTLKTPHSEHGKVGSLISAGNPNALP